MATKEEIKKWAKEGSAIRFKEIIWVLTPRDKIAIEVLEFIQRKNKNISTQEILNLLQDSQIWIKFLASSASNTIQ